MTLTFMHLIGILSTLSLIVIAGIYSGNKITGSSDFSAGGQCGSVVVAGAITGTLIGGSSTIGTVQLAYTYGLTAWWFTLGCGISCLLLAFCFIKPFRENGSKTVTGMISKEFGNTAGLLASALSSIGTFINLLAQLVAAQALISTIFPGLSFFSAMR